MVLCEENNVTDSRFSGFYLTSYEHSNERSARSWLFPLLEGYERSVTSCDFWPHILSLERVSKRNKPKRNNNNNNKVL